MYNDYTSKVLHEARRKELMNEADGGWRLKNAGLRKPTNWKRILFALVLATIFSLVLAAVPSQGQALNTSRPAQAECVLSAGEMHSLRAVSLAPGVWAVRTSSGGLLGYEGGLTALQDCTQ